MDIFSTEHQNSALTFFFHPSESSSALFLEHLSSSVFNRSIASSFSSFWQKDSVESFTVSSSSAQIVWVDADCAGDSDVAKWINDAARQRSLFTRLSFCCIPAFLSSSVYMCVHVRACAHTTRTHKQKNTHMRTNARTQAHTCTCMHTHRHTHKPTHTSPSYRP